MKDCGEASKSLLIGNGWSIEFHNKFTYTSLLEQLNQEDLNKKIVEIFDQLKTCDFERVLYSIEKTKKILDILEPDNKLNPTPYLESLKGSFLKVLGDIHPRSWDIIESSHPYTQEQIIRLFDEKSSSPRESLEEKAIIFLKNFTAYFTINYDLLLYWLLNKSSLNLDDGFRGYNNKLIFQESADQNIFYLHGGLHLHNSGTHKRKYENGNSIIDSMKESMDDHEYPTIVLEGSSESKKEAINQSPYLHWCYNKFSNINGIIFIHGFSFKENDEHIYEPIFQNKEITKIFIGLHENDKDEVKLRAANASKNKLNKENLVFYDAGSIYAK